MLALTDQMKEELHRRYFKAPLDAAAFFRPYKWCDLKDCQGLCCSGGVYPEMDVEVRMLQKLADDKRDYFLSQGIDLPKEVMEPGYDEAAKREEMGTKTRPFHYPPGLLPPHFPSTACVFRADNGACGLQLLSLAEGQHPWWYKPMPCWLFPIVLERQGKPIITIHTRDNDDTRTADYPGFTESTQCGAQCHGAGGRPAWQAFAQEIEMLSELIGRNLQKEIAAHAA